MNTPLVRRFIMQRKKQDDKVGIATVYRTVQLLEDMELIHKEMVVRI